jgi:hypothetical protein
MSTGVEHIICVYGRPRTGTTSITGELNGSPEFCVWVEKNLFTERSYPRLDDLLEAASRPGGTSDMARQYNERLGARKAGCRVLGDKSTWMGKAGGPDGFERILANLSRTARDLGVGHEVVACVREPRSWLAAWAMTHYLRERADDRRFWNSMTEDGDVRTLLEREAAGYGAHLETVLGLSDDPAVRVRCLERTRADDMGYRFDFAEYLRWAAPPACSQGDWPALLGDVKARLAERIRAGWVRTSPAVGAYARLEALHSPCAIPQADGTVREV